MKTVKVSDLSGPALDWAVAKCEGVSLSFTVIECGEFGRDSVTRRKREYSSDWSLAGPIIEREKIDTVWEFGHDVWLATIYLTNEYVEQYGLTPLVAAMRCYVASKLGDTVEIPEELV